MPLSGTISLEAGITQFCQTFLQDLPDPFSIIDKEYRIIWGNRKKAMEHGLEQRDISGKICYEIFFRREIPCPVCPVRDVLESEKACMIEKSCDLTADRRVWCQQRAVPILNQNREITSIIVYGIHTTDKIIKEQRQDRYIENLERALFEIKKDLNDTPAANDERKPGLFLTDREVQVLNLIAEGFTNPEISEILSISVHTAKTHVINIFNKLGVNNRTQAAVVAAFHQLNAR